MPFRVIYPRPNCLINQTWSLAYGRGPAGPGQLTGVIYDHSGNPVAQGNYIRVKSGKLWCMRFDNIPVGKEYRLVVRELDTGKVLATVTPFEVQPTRFIGISYPTTSDMPVESEFLVWGGTDVTVALTATLGTTYNGDYLFGPPNQPKGYTFEFTGVAAGNGYPLVVSGGGSTANESVDVA